MRCRSQHLLNSAVDRGSTPARVLETPSIRSARAGFPCKWAGSCGSSSTPCSTGVAVAPPRRQPVLKRQGRVPQDRLAPLLLRPPARRPREKVGKCRGFVSLHPLAPRSCVRSSSRPPTEIPTPWEPSTGGRHDDPVAVIPERPYRGTNQTSHSENLEGRYPRSRIPGATTGS
jgi:hypothetical protein